ncbi:GNAT family N-acetyltransferase [Paenibacillus antri]|uniref:GNAT family N-acetyltransferase n=1 Tax=Paenibacillus antri TaxID=2582848 RepID=A0A5R9GA72_9BACL|nr:GNAT family N-acetyltransferase [Paenibacillus antri]TLS50980.1 GNAT family N-acetyltransferase [Paenibacillus antri]
MKALTERILSGAAASAALPFVIFGGSRLLGHSGGADWQAFLFVSLYSLPVFLTLGIAASVLADWLADRIDADAGEGGSVFRRGVRSYFVHLVLYAAAGYGIFIGLVRLLDGADSPESTSLLGATLGVSAAVLYYHALLVFRGWGASSHRRRFGEVVETDRLVLEPCTEERYAEANREGYPLGNHVKTYMQSLRRHPKLLGWGVWFVRLKETGEIIGDAGFKGNPDYTGAVDIGYGFLPEHRGRGYATETAKALVAWAFAHGAGRVTAETLRDNAASIRVLRKNGFRLYREEEHYHWLLDASERLRGR